MGDRFTIEMKLIVKDVFFKSAFLFFLEPHKSEVFFSNCVVEPISQMDVLCYLHSGSFPLCKRASPWK